jgi:CRISPR system Cascade subunit CasD
MKSIALKFAGPLQSWGTDSTYETRHSDLYPSKSAVIGFVAAALGYRRDEDEKIQALNNLDFAVRIDQNGKLLRDFHTARKNKSNGDFDRNYVTNRYYMEDAVYVVALGHENNLLVEEIEHAIKQPYFQLSLGRRSCPVAYDYFLGTYDGDVISTLESIEWKAADWYKRRNSNVKYLTIYADANLLSDYKSHPRRDDVISFDQRSRQYSYRLEAEKNVKIHDDYASTSHDAFGAVGE